MPHTVCPPAASSKRKRWQIITVLLYAVLMLIVWIFLVRRLFTPGVPAECRGLYQALAEYECARGTLKGIGYYEDYPGKFTVLQIRYEFENPRPPEQLIGDAVAVRALTEQYLSQHPEEAAVYRRVEIEFHDQYDASPNYISMCNYENDGSVPDAVHLHRGHFVVQNAPLFAFEGADSFAVLTLWDFALPEDFSALDAQDALRELNMLWTHPPDLSPQAAAAVAEFETKHPECAVNIAAQTEPSAALPGTDSGQYGKERS